MLTLFKIQHKQSWRLKLCLHKNKSEGRIYCLTFPQMVKFSLSLRNMKRLGVWVSIIFTVGA